MTLEILAFFSIVILGTVSPGPDFVIVTRYGLSGSRKAAFAAVAGISTALVVHVVYCLLGVAIFLQSSFWMSASLQCVGSMYLGYVGLSLLLEKPPQETAAIAVAVGKAFRRGFFTNLLNLKASFFLLSLFTQFITPTTSGVLKIFYGSMVPVLALGWFGFLSYILTHPIFFTKIRKYQYRASRWMGILLLVLSIYVIGKTVFFLF